MEYKRLNDTNEKLPEIGIGTWKMGVDPEREKDAIRAALENGMELVDTAEMYATEWIVGDAVKGMKRPFLATKVSPSHFRHSDVIAACERSLQNLQVKSIDLYQLHWPNHSVPIKETMGAMEELADSGKIRHIGVSNFTVAELIEAQEAMENHEIVSNQVEYSILARDIEEELLQFCAEGNVTIIAYSPLGTGSLYSPKYAKTLAALTEIGKAHNKTAAQVALNWVVSKKNVVAIPKAGSREHVIENAGASGWKLSKSETAELDSLEERKKPIAGFFSSVIKSSGIWAGAMQSFNEKRSRIHRNSNTTKSSKK